MRHILTRLTMPLLFLVQVVFQTSSLNAQAFQGYTLFSAEGTRNTYLIDMNKTAVHTWTHNRNGGYSSYLLEDGSVLRPANVTNPKLQGGGAAGMVQRVSWNGAVLWEYTYSSATYLSHHDIKRMPNGNILMIAWEVKTAAQAVQAGLNRSSVIWPDHLIEVQPTALTGGNIVWEWHAWDHLVQEYDASKANYGKVAEHPELLNINMGAGGVGPMGGDWMHINSVSYNPELDQIVMSSHTLNEIYVIDHSATTAEAAGHTGGRSGKGGDILYRWGMPSNYGASGAQYFYVVHCATWIAAGLPGEGHILAFNNGDNQKRSIVVELVPPVDGDGHYSRNAPAPFGPASPVWSYTASDFYTDHLGSCQRLPNGNTLMVESTSGYLVEVNTAGVIQWSYSRGGQVVRALRYAPDYPGLSALTGAERSVSADANEFTLEQNAPNPFVYATSIRYTTSFNAFVSLKIFDLFGREIRTLVDEFQSPGSYMKSLDLQSAPLSPGMYFCTLTAGSVVRTVKMIVTK